MLGPSGVQFVRGEEAATLPSLLAEELNRDSGRNWRVDSELVYPMANMAERVMGYVSSYRPDVLLFALGATAFAEESVTFRIRRRFPGLYGPATRLIAIWKAAAGGAAEGSGSLRGGLFRIPGAAAARLIGTAPLVDPAVALRATLESLESVAAAAPGLRVVCRLANGHFQHAGQAREIERRTLLYNDTVREACGRLGIPVYDQRQAIVGLGWDYVLSPDGLHTDLDTLVRAAKVAADQVRAAVAAPLADARLTTGL